MEFVAIFLGVLVLLAIVGTGLLIAGLCSKKRRKKLLILGACFFAPLVLFALWQVVLSIFDTIG